VPKLPKVRRFTPPKLKKLRFGRGAARQRKFLPIPELPPPTLWERITGGGGSALGALEKGYGYVSELPYRAGFYLGGATPEARRLSLGERLKYTFGSVEAPKEVPTYERPFEAVQQLAAGAMDRPSLERVPKVVKGIAAGAAGIAGGIALDPFAIIGTAAKAVPAATRLGKVAGVIGKPFMAVPRGVQKYLVKPAEAMLAGTKLAKPISGLKLMAAPFVLAGKTVQKITPKGAAWIATAGKKIARKLNLNATEKALKHDMNISAASAGKAVDAVAAVEKRGTFSRGKFLSSLYDWANLRRTGTKFGGKSTILHKVLLSLGDKGIASAADDLIKNGGAEFGQALIRGVEQGPEVGLQLMRGRLSAQGDALYRGMIEEFRAMSDSWFDLKKQAALQHVVNKYGPASKQASFPEMAEDLQKALYESTPPLKLKTIRINPVPHDVDTAAHKWLVDNNRWIQTMDNAREILKNDPRGLSALEIENIMRESREHFVVAREGLGELPRIPLFRELSIEEINRAAEAAGLPQKMRLMTEHVSAYSGEGRSTIARLAYEDAKVSAVKAATEIGVRQQAEAVYGGSLKYADWIERNSYAVDKLDDLRKGTGHVKGWWFLKHGDEWVVLNDDIGTMMENMKQITGQTRVNSDGLWAGMSKWWNKALGAYKGIVLNYSPGYTVTNAMDDTIRFAIMEGLTPAIDGYAMDAKMMGGAKQIFSFSDALQTLDRSDVDRWLLSRALLAGQTVAEEPMRLRYGLRALNEMAESGRRRAFFLGALQKYSVGNDYATAAQKALDAVETALFAYSDITPFEEKLAKGILFYRFFRKNIAYQLRAFAMHPWRQFALLKAPAMLFGESPSFEEERVLPEWMRMRGPFVIERRPDGTTVFNAGLRLSIYDLNKLWPDQWYREGVGMLAPMLNIPLELISGRYLFLDLPIKDMRRLYTPAIGKALEALNPLLKGVGFEDFATRYKGLRNDGTEREYWVVPSWLMYLMSKFRPANDLRRLLDPRNQNKLWFFVSGMRDYPYDMEKLVEGKIQEGLERELAEARARGTVGRMEIDYITKFIEAPAEEKEEAMRAVMQMRGLSLRRRTKGAGNASTNRR
jgi:hypothetical protein